MKTSQRTFFPKTLLILIDVSLIVHLILFVTAFLLLLNSSAAETSTSSGTPSNAPDHSRLLTYTKHFTEPAKGPEFVMPVGSGDLAGMVSFDTALQLHLSKSDWFGRPQLTESGTGSAGGGKFANMSPGHITLSLGGLTAEKIRQFDQFMDFYRGSVIVKLDTTEGPVELEVFGDMSRKALLIHVRDDRGKRQEATTVTLSNWREGMRISTQDSVITGEEIHKTTRDGKAVTDPNKVPANDCLYNLGLGIAIGGTGAKISNNALEFTPQASEYDVVITAEVTRDGQPLAAALAKQRDIQAANLKELHNQQLGWWQNFWDQSWIELTGDNDATYLTRLWLTDLYTFAGIFSGKLPPTFTGAQLLVMKDYSSWAGAYTFQNTREMIWPMGAANHNSFSELYLKTYDRYFDYLQKSTATLGKIGIRVPEYINIMENPDLAWQRSNPPRRPTPFDKNRIDNRENQTLENLGAGHTIHILQDGGELIQLMFDHVRYSGDEQFLKNVCAPWLREFTLFYLNYLKQGEDGLWHMTPSNAAETWWKVKDPLTDLCAVRYCFEQVIKYGNQLGYEPELINLVKERLNKLAPIPLGGIFYSVKLLKLCRAG
ncbi:MAG: hypothetical protein WCI20_08830 [bacterium]